MARTEATTNVGFPSQEVPAVINLTMDNKKLLASGMIGTVIAALCCFTPVLVILFGAVGLSAAVAYLDYVLLPALFIFAGIAIYALWRQRNGSCETKS